MPTNGLFDVTPREQRYRLPGDGDRWEQRFWPQLQGLFPNYEAFWQRYIVPLSRRDLDGDIHIRPGIPPEWEDLAMCHYSILIHLGVAWETLDGLRKQGQGGQHQGGKDDTTLPGQIILGQAFFHPGAAVEAVDRLLWSLLLLAPALREFDPQRLCWQEIQKRMEGFYRESYEKLFGDFRATGRSVSAYLQPASEVLARLVRRLGKPGRKAYGELKKVDCAVRKYRNRCVHDPIQGIVEQDGKLLLPEVGQIAAYARWSAVFYPEDERVARGHFRDGVEAGCAYTDDLLSALNTLWLHLLRYLEEVLLPWAPAAPSGESGEKGADISPYASSPDSASKLFSEASHAVVAGTDSATRTPHDTAGSADWTAQENDHDGSIDASPKRPTR